VCFVAVEVVKFVHAIARVLKTKAGRRPTFGTGVAISLPFFFSLEGAGRLLR
jgi:hypothetical protein